MTLRGHIKNGKVILEEPAPLPEGTEVDVVLKRRPATRTKNPGRTVRSTKRGRAPKSLRGGSFADRYADFIGAAKGLPADSSRNLDHYLYGAPRR